MVGWTNARNLPTTDGAFDSEYRDVADYGDGYLCVFNLTSKQISYLTYIGGRMRESLSEVEFDRNDMVYIAGESESSDFYTSSGAFSTIYDSLGDGVIVKIDPIPGTPSSAPFGFLALPSDWEIFLNWSRPSDEGGCRILRYELSRFNASTGEWDLLLQEYNFFYHDMNVSNGKSYRYRVCAVSNLGAGTFAELTMTVPAVIPTIPLNLTARTGDGTVTLNWSSPAFDGGGRITSYVIMRGLARDEMGEVAQLGNETSWVDMTVELGTFYYFKVAAKNSAGMGPFTPEVRIKPVGLPSSPRSFSVTPGDGRVDLSWALPSSTGGMMLLGFKVYRGTNPGNVAFLATKIITELSHSDTGVTNGISYLYYVTAYTELGESIPSIILDATPFGIPGKPANLTAIVGNGEVVLSWEAPISDGGRAINGYKIYYGEDGGDISFLVKIGNTTSFRHTGLVNGHLYVYDVRAVNEAGDGPVSERTSARPIGPPGIAGDFHADIALDGVRLDWDAPAMTGGATLLHYRILRGLQATGLESIKEVVGSTEYLDTGLSKGTTYYYQLQAFNDVGSGPLTDVVSVTYITVPDAVTDLASRAGNAKVTLTWSAPLSDGGTPLTGYSIRRGLFESGLNEIKWVSSGSLNYTDEGVVNGKTYFYSVLALNAIGASSTGPMVNVTPRAPPGQPVGFVLKVEGNTVVLTWFKPTVAGRATVTGYRLLRGTSPGDLVLLADLGDVQTYTDITVEKGKDYYYVLMANSDAGPGDRTLVIKADLKVKKDGPGFDVGIAIGALVIIGLLACMSNRRKP
jgi:titin